MFKLPPCPQSAELQPSAAARSPIWQVAHSFCLQKVHGLGTRKLELVMFAHKQWALVTRKCHLRLSTQEVGNKRSTTCQKMPKGPFFQVVRSHASCRDPAREELEEGRELCRHEFHLSQRRFWVICRIIDVCMISDRVCLTNSSLIFIPTGREQDPQREDHISQKNPGINVDE